MSSFTIKKATRALSPLKILFAGVPGTGKTYSSLLFALNYAKALNLGRVLIIDTEKNASALYAESFGANGYDIMDLPNNATGKNYIDAITEAEKHGYKMIIIDTISSEYNSLLTEVQNIQSSTGRSNGMLAWAKANPLHNAFRTKILESESNIICTVRAKFEYDIGKDANGKTKVDVVGERPDQKKGIEYEFSIYFLLKRATSGNKDLSVIVNKDRLNIFNLNEVHKVIDKNYVDKVVNFIKFEDQGLNDNSLAILKSIVKISENDFMTKYNQTYKTNYIGYDSFFITDATRIIDILNKISTSDADVKKFDDSLSTKSAPKANKETQSINAEILNKINKLSIDGANFLTYINGVTKSNYTSINDIKSKEHLDICLEAINKKEKALSNVA